MIGTDVNCRQLLELPKACISDWKFSRFHLDKFSERCKQRRKVGKAFLTPEPAAILLTIF